MKPTTSDDLFDLIDGYLTSAAVGTAMETGLFWLLAKQPLDAEGVARALAIPANRCHAWLQLLAGIDLLESRPEGYVPSPTARVAILETYGQETWAFLAGEARVRFPVIRELATHIHNPEPCWDAQGLTPPNHYFAQLREDPERAGRFTRMLYEIHLPLGEELAARLEMRGGERILDLGGGSGVMSLALLRRHPAVRAVVLDIAHVCAAGREIAAQHAVGDRLLYQAGDYEQEDLPAPFDLVLMCDAGPLSKAMFRKTRSALKPGGRLAIVEQFAPHSGEAHPARLHWSLLASLEGAGPRWVTAEEVRARLKQAGFQPVSETALVTSEVQRWSGGWTLLLARMGVESDPEG